MVHKIFTDNVIYAKIVFGQHTGKHVFITRIPLSPAEMTAIHSNLSVSNFQLDFASRWQSIKHMAKQFQMC